MIGARARAERISRLLAGLVVLGWSAAVFSGSSASAFRVTPYLQNPSQNAVTITWFSENDSQGRLRLESEEGVEIQSMKSIPIVATALEYQAAEKVDVVGKSPPFHHELRLVGLLAGESYRFVVEQDGDKAGGEFKTPSSELRPMRFIVFGDSETEPESVGKFTAWPGTDEADLERRYLVDQDRGYRANLDVIKGRSPDFVAIAGDLVESGGEQRDWDEFWRLTAPLASGTFLLPALGNHEYFGGPGSLGQYGAVASKQAVARYLTYFDLPANHSVKPAHDERYYTVEWGAVSLVVLDLNNGLPHRSSMDTNWFLLGSGEGGLAPDWKPGSVQYQWLEQALAKAQAESEFTFVMFHYCPYSSGVHGQVPGEGAGEDRLSGRPLRVLTPLFMRYGVDVLLTGHDEMYEHSVIPGQEVLLDGQLGPHALHVYDVGVGGDGLRGPIAGLENPYRVFLAHEDSPEIRDTQGVLIDGGKHYGHLEINVGSSENGVWEARLDMVYLFPVTGEDGQVSSFERRLYDDTTILFSRPPSPGQVPAQK